MTIETVTSASADTHPQTTWEGQGILDALLAELPEATSALQQQALDALKRRQYNKCKAYSCVALDDPFIKAIGYMSSVPSVIDKKIPTLPTLMAESCRAIADATYRHALDSGTGYVRSKEGTLQALRREKLTKLESLNQQIFTKVLKD